MSSDIHVHLHIDLGERATAKLDAIFAQNERLLMAAADVKAALAKIDAATNDIAADIKGLKAKIGTGMTDAEVAEVQAEADRLATKLEGIAADTENPVPS